MLPHIKTVLRDLDCRLLQKIEEEIDGLADIFSLIDRSIVADPPIQVREGGIIQDGFDATVDNTVFVIV